MESNHYYAVIFTSTLKLDSPEYHKMATAMEELARTQKGFLGFESARDEIGISISYWDSLEAISNWKNNGEHFVAQQLGQQQWYESYKVRICKVEREYDFNP